MANISDEPLERTHIHMYTSDVEWYKQYFGQTVGYSKAVRSVLRNYRRKIEAKAAQHANSVNPDPIDLEL